MSLVAQHGVEQLQNFFEKLYQDQSGFVYLAYKSPKKEDSSFTQEFFHWPKEKSLIFSRIRTEQAEKEVYFAPALFDKKDAHKINVKGAYCLWAEFDGKVPNDSALKTLGIPKPTIRVQSSDEGHEHWYWIVSSFLSVTEIELSNRKLTYALGADVSGWDANQILRPPGTINHKRDGSSVELLSLGDGVQLSSFAESLDDAPPVLDLPVPTEIPAVEDVIAKISIPPKLFMLFKKGLPEGHRSEGLMALAFGFAEITPMLNNDELLTIILNADNRWGKFKNRSDQIKRLLDIISKVRVKVPYVEPTASELQQEEDRFKFYGYTSLLKIDVQLEWIWNGLLHAKGYMLVTGAPGVGKSQLSLNFAGQACIGSNFLDREIKEPRRIGFLSLEMGVEEIQYFVNIQSKGYSPEQLTTLEENLLIFPMGEPLYLSDGHEKNRKKVEELIGDNHLDGIIIDSLGSITPDELVSEKVRGIMDWNDRLRQRLGCFTWYVHHHRKATGDNKRPNKLSDVYGSQYITARATTVMCLWEINNQLSLIPLKIRLSRRPDSISVLRDQNLHYSINNEAITVVKTTSSGISSSGVESKDKLFKPKMGDDLPGMQGLTKPTFKF